MKDYYDGKIDKFILYYKEEGNKIKVHFSNEIKECENTKEVREFLQQMMHRQIRFIDFDENIKEFNKESKANKIFITGNLIVTIINLIAFIMFLNPLNLIALCINIGGIIYSIVLGVKNNIDSVDMEKMKLYLDNEEKLNDNCNINPELINNLSNKEYEFVPSSESMININSIEYLKKEELGAIIDDINNNNNINDKHKKLTRKR